MSATPVPDEQREIAVLAAEIERIDAHRAATNPVLREAFRVLGPLVQDLPSTDVMIFAEPAIVAWHALRREDAELFMCYRATVRDRCGRHIVSLLDERLSRNDGARPRNVVALEIGELLSRRFPPMEPLLSPWLCKQHLSMVHAWRGVGKTHFALGVAYAVAGGGKFLKWKAEQPWRVVYIDGEMAGAAIKARLAAIVESSPEESEPPESFFRIITPDAQPLPLPDLASLQGQATLAPCIADADLIVVDNLSCLMRSGAENEGESWVPVAEWALELRRLGKAVLFVHHDGKGGQQRGTSRKEDLMDVVIKLDHVKDYEAEMGAAFTVEFEKARHLSGEDARDLEAALTKDDQGRQAWVWKDAEMGMSERILALHAEAPDMSQTEIAAELGCNRSTVSRALKGARAQGAGGIQ